MKKLKIRQEKRKKEKLMDNRKILQRKWKEK
jgi:hypothetical protein